MKYTYNDRVLIQSGELRLHGHLVIPENAKGIVLFSECMESGRMSPSNQKLSMDLTQKGIGIFVFDLLTEEEDKDYFKHFHIELLTSRLITATQWLRSKSALYKYPLGYYGTGTGAAAALDAASILPDIHAVVCYGGRPDLTIMPLPRLTTPVMLITESHENDILKINEEAMRNLACPKRLEVIRDTSQLIKGSGHIDNISMLANKWFTTYLKPAGYALAESSTNKFNKSLKKYKS